MKIIFTGGGTGGHVFPIIAIAREIKKNRPDAKLYYLGPKDKIGSFLLLREGIEVKTILAGKIRRYFTFKSFFQNLLDVFKVPIGFIQSFFLIFFISPDLVFSKSGYGALTTSIMARIFNTPVISHESDIVPGLTNKIVNKLAIEVFVSFPSKNLKTLFSKKMLLVGNPVRAEILNGDADTAAKIFELKKGKPIILVLGGSQGAQKINDVLLSAIPELLKDFQIIHQVGSKNLKQVQTEADVMIRPPLNRYYHIFPFFNENQLKHAYKACDLVISRAGAGSIFEIAACGKPSILIPLPKSAQNHQAKNAYLYQSFNACVVIEENNLTPNFLAAKIKYLSSNPDKLSEMENAAKEFSRPRAAEIIAKYIVEYLS